MFEGSTSNTWPVAGGLITTVTPSEVASDTCPTPFRARTVTLTSMPCVSCKPETHSRSNGSSGSTVGRDMASSAEAELANGAGVSSLADSSGGGMIAAGRNADTSHGVADPVDVTHISYPTTFVSASSNPSATTHRVPACVAKEASDPDSPSSTMPSVGGVASTCTSWLTAEEVMLAPDVPITVMKKDVTLRFGCAMAEAAYGVAKDVSITAKCV